MREVTLEQGRRGRRPGEGRPVPAGETPATVGAPGASAAGGAHHREASPPARAEQAGGHGPGRRQGPGGQRQAGAVPRVRPVEGADQGAHQCRRHERSRHRGRRDHDVVQLERRREHQRRLHLEAPRPDHDLPELVRGGLLLRPDRHLRAEHRLLRLVPAVRQGRRRSRRLPAGRRVLGLGEEGSDRVDLLGLPGR